VTTYLTNTTDPVSLGLDLHIGHDHFGSTSDPTLNGHLQYPEHTNKSLNESVTGKTEGFIKIDTRFMN
jgi:hypothetical protein